MDILRLPPYPLTFDVIVPQDATTYDVFIGDEAAVEYTSDVDVYAYDGEPFISIDVPVSLASYDGEYSLVVKDNTEIVYEDTLRVVRPYVDVAKEYQDKDFATYSEYEKIARLAIDNIVGGFYYTKNTFERMVLDQTYCHLDIQPRNYLRSRRMARWCTTVLIIHTTM